MCVIVCVHGLFDRGQMSVRRVKLPGSTQQLIDLSHSRRRHIGISRQGLRHKVVGLNLVEQLLPLKRECVHLLCGIGGGQGHIGGVELLTELFGLSSE